MRVPHCRSSQAHNPFRILLSALLLWSSIPVRCSVEGRPLFKLQETLNDRQLLAAEEGKVMARALIGSTPPRCDAIRCISCGRCEAVQVPVIPHDKKLLQEESAVPSSSTAAYYGDYGSNYKPMKWSCKCGDRIFNP